MSDEKEDEVERKVVKVPLNEGEKKSEKVNTINRLHYYYGALVMGLLIIVLISLMFADSTYAGSMLSFAATLSSILLAVIAIIITLIDVAGQRNNILDVKNSVEELKTVSSEINKLVFDFENRIDKRDKEMISLMSQFDVKNSTTNNKIEELAKKLDLLSESGDSGEGLAEIKKDLGKIKDSLETPAISRNSFISDFLPSNSESEQQSDVNYFLRTKRKPIFESDSDEYEYRLDSEDGILKRMRKTKKSYL